MSDDRQQEAVLEADLSAFSTADALHWAGSSRFGGRLRFSRDGRRIELLIAEGQLINAASSARNESFGSHLFAEGLIDDFDLAAATVYSRDNQARVGTAIVELGVLGEDVVREQLQQHLVNLAELPLEWGDGRLTAHRRLEDDGAGIEAERIDLNFLMIESARRKDEIDRIRKYLPTDDCTLGFGVFELDPTAPARQLRITGALKEGDTTRELYERIGGSYHQFLWALRRLLKESILEVLDAVEPRSGGAGP